jgi:hypothetical protein
LGLSDKSDAQASSEVPLSKVADIITKGHSKPISMKPKSKQGIGRKKRK